MVDLDTLTLYLAVLVGFVVLPGPATLLTLARASTSGSRAGIATGLGIAVGDLGHTLLAILGISAIVAASATLFTLVKLLGAAYLVYLGIRAFRERSDAPRRAAAVRISPRDAFRQAILVELLNPKSAMFFLAFLPQFVSVDNGPVWSQLLVLGLLFVLTGFAGLVIVSIGADRLGTLLRGSRTLARWQGRFVGTVYCAVGIRLAFQER